MAFARELFYGDSRGSSVILGSVACEHEQPRFLLDYSGENDYNTHNTTTTNTIPSITTQRHCLCAERMQPAVIPLQLFTFLPAGACTYPHR